MPLLTEWEFDFNPPSLEKFLKKYGGGKRRQRMESLYQQMLEEAQACARPQFLFEQFSAAEVAALQRWLSPDTASVILGVCTLGHGLHNRLIELGQEDVVAEHILNEIAVEWLRNIVTELHQALRQLLAPQGLKAGPTYRPGVGRWPIEAQRVVFACVAADTIGVTLDEALFMTPTLSNSLIIPVLKR